MDDGVIAHYVLWLSAAAVDCCPSMSSHRIVSPRLATHGDRISRIRYESVAPIAGTFDRPVAVNIPTAALCAIEDSTLFPHYVLYGSS